MEKNVNTVDRVVRIVLAILIIIIAYYNRQLLGLIEYALYLIAIVLLITGIKGYCHLYKVLGKDNNKKSNISKKSKK